MTTLPSGLRIVTQTVADMPSVAMGVWVGAGARAERVSEHGMAHLLEHMAFKGTTTRSAQAIAETIENVGGDINAATSMEQTAYYVRVLAEDVPVGIDILADILLNSVFEPAELEREKSVIVQEIAASLDSPDDLIFDLLQDASYPGQALGRPILGTPDSVTGFSQGDIFEFLKRHYHAARCVIVAAGAVDHESFVAHAARSFANLPQAPSAGVDTAVFMGEERVVARPLEQVQLAFSLPGPTYGDPFLYPTYIFAGLLGGGMSSRLFQEVREKRGLCYSVSSFSWPYADTGLFAMHAATSPEKTRDLVQVMLDVLHETAHNVTHEEVARAKAQVKAGLLMSLESMPSRAERVARQLLIFDRIIPVEETTARIDAVEVEHVKQMAQDMLSRKKMAFAAVGPKNALPSLQEISALATA